MVKSNPNKRSKNKTAIPTNYTISKDMMISELVRIYPEVGQMLSYEWGFHCINCFISEFETLEQGATTHGIVDTDFEIMMDMINKMVLEINSM